MSLLKPRARVQPKYAAGFAAECHPNRPEAREGKCRECLAIERADRKATTAIARSVREQQALTEVLQNEVSHLQELAAEARRIVQERLPDYARLHYEAAERAAITGDAKPAQWALENVVAQPYEDPSKPTVAVKKEITGGGGMQVFIGVKLGGSEKELPATVEVTEVTSE